MKTKKSIRDVTDREFIEAWQRAGTLKKLVAALGLAREVLSQKAARLRHSGVPLKKMPQGATKGVPGRKPGSNRKDFAPLIELAKSLATEGA